jgi:hypothetical protein
MVYPNFNKFQFHPELLTLILNRTLEEIRERKRMMKPMTKHPH